MRPMPRLIKPPGPLAMHYSRNLIDMEAPFIREVRLSLEIWIRKLIKNELILRSGELSGFIQFRVESVTSSSTSAIHSSHLKHGGGGVKMHMGGGKYSKRHHFGESAWGKGGKDLSRDSNSGGLQKKTVSLEDFTLLKVEHFPFSLSL